MTSSRSASGSTSGSSGFGGSASSSPGSPSGSGGTSTSSPGFCAAALLSSVARAFQARLNFLVPGAGFPGLTFAGAAGAAGAVADLVSRLSPEVSPTYKPVPLFGIAPANYTGSELNKLLGPSHNACVVQQRTGRGVIVLRGLDTSGDQISVTRVADAAIRETKAISENFIGQLNSSDARAALRAQIVATFTRMERAGQLVPSTDGSDPAFVVDVYSTQQDFAQGIVRIEIAIRPVRAIDFIYASIRVKN